MPKKYDSMMTRLFYNSIIDHRSDCWNWIGAINPRGYGSLTVREPGKYYPVKKYAHRVSYETFVGLIPAGFEIDHLCANSSCINPGHLQAVLHKQNIELRDERKKRRLSVISGQAWLACNDR